MTHAELVVTVDTEANNLWAQPTRYTCANVSRLPRFQALCERHGIRPTYLVSHEVMAEAAAVATLKRLARGNRCEIGTHLHPFSTPPEFSVTPDDRVNQPFAYEYPDDVLEAKLETLTVAVRQAFEVQPRSIRWGRWGVSGRMVALMERNGYRVDSTVTPGLDWTRISGRRRDRAPSFAAAPATPYFLGYADAVTPGPSSVLEVPATVVFRGPRSHLVYLFLAAWRLGRLGRPLGIAPRWLRPFPSVSAGRLVATALLALRQRLPVLNVMLHSSELLPGGSPYAATEGDVGKLVGSLDRLFDVLRSRGVTSTTLGELYDRYRPSPAESHA
jgi:hypothetical protein